MNKPLFRWLDRLRQGLGVTLLTLMPLSGLLATEATQARETLRVGVEGAYPPFSQITKDGQLTGFDIDIAHALCERLDMTCVLIPQSFDGMIPGLNARKFDAVIASMSITPEREKAVLFTNRYYKTPGRLIVRRSSAIDGSPQSLRGIRIGVQRATIYDRYATDRLKDSRIVRYGRQDEVFLDLSAGRLDAALADSAAMESGFLNTRFGRDFTFTGPPFVERAYFGVGAGIALRKEDTALRDRLNAALASLRADGSYERIQRRYFSFDVYGEEPAR